MKNKLSVMALGVLTALALALPAAAQEYPSWDAPLTIPSTITFGEPFTISGGGFAPGTQVRVRVFSDPIDLGTVTADAAGEFSAEVELPENLEAGVHTITASGEAADGGTLTLGAQFTVEGDLSATGNILPTGLIVVAALAGMAGLAAVLAARFTGAKAQN